MVEVPEPLWRFDPADPADVWILAVEAGVFVVAGRQVYALDRATGAVIWTHDLYDAVGAAPPVWVDGTVAVALQGYRSVVALDAATGGARWDRAPADPDGILDFHRSQVAAGQGRLWVVDFEGAHLFDLDGAHRATVARAFASGNPIVDRAGSVWTEFSAATDEVVAIDAGGDIEGRWDSGGLRMADHGRASIFALDKGVVWSNPRGRPCPGSRW